MQGAKSPAVTYIALHVDQFYSHTNITKFVLWPQLIAEIYVCVIQVSLEFGKK